MKGLWVVPEEPDPLTGFLKAAPILAIAPNVLGSLSFALEAAGAVPADVEGGAVLKSGSVVPERELNNWDILLLGSLVGIFTGSLFILLPLELKYCDILPMGGASKADDTGNENEVAKLSDPGVAVMDLKAA